MPANKLKIGLIGYGKMGKTIEKIAEARGHQIVLRINSQNLHDFTAENLKNLDIAIEFTNPKSAAKNLDFLAQQQVPTVCGSTAWLSDYDRIKKHFEKTETPFLYASNFSIGVNVLFAVNNYLAKIMGQIPEYDVRILESHHLEKKDAPSGTAVTLAEQIIEGLARKDNWQLKPNKNSNHIEIEAIREKDVKGLHEIRYTSQIDEITIKHEAFSREGFAIGAIMASEFIYNKRGIFSMNDVLKIS